MRKICLAALGLCAAAVTVQAQTMAMNPLQKLQYAEHIIEKFYVDSVNSETMVESAITAMLKKLDPHSQYTNAEETREFTEPLSGNFSGIGIQFNMATDTVYVIQTIAGGPSERVGILAGDRIISANDTVIAGKKLKNSQVMKHLRGPKGTVVDLGVMRRGVPDTLNFRVVRDDIPIYSVDAAYMIDPATGYVRVSRFAETTFDEMKKALGDLRKKGMKNLVIDLQDNGGGFLQAATQVAELFLDKGDRVVYTQGENTRPMYFDVTKNGPYRDCKVVVLVNQYSASASEILSGALQDNDRGVIVGRRTYGKGLVQRPFPFPDGSMIRLTVARYYTPSGRCIQKPYNEGDDDYYADIMHRYDSGELTNADSIHFSDSLLFRTNRLNRPVYGGGGIMPDRFVPIDTVGYSDYYRDLMAKGVLYRYCLKYVEEYRADIKKNYPDVEAFVKGFTVTPAMMDEMVAFGEKEGVSKNAEQLAVSSAIIHTILKAYIGRDIYDEAAFYRVANGLNPIYKKGVDIISSQEEYSSVLSPSDK